MIMKRKLVFPAPQDVVIVIEKQKSLNIAVKAFCLWYLQYSELYIYYAYFTGFHGLFKFLGTQI